MLWDFFLLTFKVDWKLLNDISIYVLRKKGSSIWRIALVQFLKKNIGFENGKGARSKFYKVPRSANSRDDNLTRR
uniref:Uncharacterized protein n=1 Tax=Nelumbo nucifera TaxID=4432 RepID=A0A822Y3I5_NELNU|nr:TPA_asm: hypothetical protein HUJ06_028455 [Nelumbo nucifera]